MRWNPAMEQIVSYVGGKGIEEVAREYGVRDVVKLGSNELPTEPFPEVVEAIASLASGVNRYPDAACTELGSAAAKAFGVPVDHLWFGAGSGELIRVMAAAVGGPGSSAVFPWRSFGLYPIATAMSGAREIRVPLDASQAIDLDAMAAAVESDTSIVYVCNPNNPSGTHLTGAELESFIGSLPDDLLVVVDEAYAEYVTAHDWGTMIPVALRQPNVVVLRTFSKIYGLAGLRIGYAIGRPETLAGLRRAQRPFTVTQLAQDAAREALRYPGRVEQRRLDVDRGRRILFEGLVDRGLEVVPSQGNFVYCQLGPDVDRVVEKLLQRGVVIRQFDEGWCRITVGTELENRRFLMALDTSL